jgi:hypothetical protein
VVIGHPLPDSVHAASLVSLIVIACVCFGGLTKPNYLSCTWGRPVIISLFTPLIRPARRQWQLRPN